MTIAIDDFFVNDELQKIKAFFLHVEPDNNPQLPGTHQNLIELTNVPGQFIVFLFSKILEYPSYPGDKIKSEFPLRCNKARISLQDTKSGYRVFYDEEFSVKTLMECIGKAYRIFKKRANCKIGNLSGIISAVG